MQYHCKYAKMGRSLDVTMWLYRNEPLKDLCRSIRAEWVWLRNRPTRARQERVGRTCGWGQQHAGAPETSQYQYPCCAGNQWNDGL